MNIDTMIEKWQEEFAFCEQQEIFNTKNKKYITAHNHAVKKEQIRLFIKDLQQEKNLNIPVSGSLTPFGESIKLLRDLADLQNGAPLEQHRQEWEETMEQVYDFLNKWEGQ